MHMAGLRAKVHHGRLQMDEPTDLPDGTVLDLVVDDQGDDLDEAERTARDEAITRAWRSVLEGRGRSAEEILQRLARR